MCVCIIEYIWCVINFVFSFSIFDFCELNTAHVVLLTFDNHLFSLLLTFVPLTSYACCDLFLNALIRCY